MVRAYVPGESDALADLFSVSVHRVASADYSPEQCAAWASTPPDYEHWRTRLQEGRTFVAEINRASAGFATFITPDHLDLLYVHPDRQRQGVASALLAEVERAAREAGATEISTFASLTARGFFEHSGFSIIRNNVVHRSGIEIPNFLMHKPFRPTSETNEYYRSSSPL
jgi:putative acetyltransferase